MIVGSKIINRPALISACINEKTIVEFARNLVPRFIRHNKEIVDNQRYLVALEVRELNEVPYGKKIKLTNALLSGILIRGTLNRITDIEDIMISVNMDMILEKLFENEIKEINYRKYDI